MNFLGIFGKGKSDKKKKKNKKGEKNNITYSVKDVKMFVSSLMGSGPKKQ